MNMWAVSDMQTGIQRTRDHQSERGKGGKRGKAVLWQIRLSPCPAWERLHTTPH